MKHGAHEGEVSWDDADIETQGTDSQEVPSTSREPHPLTMNQQTAGRHRGSGMSPHRGHSLRDQPPAFPTFS